MSKDRMSKGLSFLLTLVLFLSQGVFAYSAETNFWKERRLAQLTVNAPPPGSSFRRTPESIPSRDDGKFDAGPQSNGNIILIQDIHRNIEAQTHIAALLESLIASRKAGAIAVEGAFEKFDFSPFRAFPDQSIVKETAQEFFDQKRLAAPSYVGLMNENIPDFIGVDDRRHHRANLDAYLESRPLAPRIEKTIEKKILDLNVKKEDVFNSDLKKYDALRTAYQDKAIGIGSYLRRLSSFTPHDVPLMAQTFLEAYELEAQFDFNRVQAERQRLVSRLLPELSKSESDNLVSLSLAFRTGKIAHGDFYRFLENTAKRHDVSLNSYPMFQDYIRYVLLSDSIRADELLSGLHQMETAVENALVQTDRERELLDHSRRLHLSKKLVRFELTPQEWDQYQRGTRNPALGTFERFYEEADIRSAIIVDNSIKNNVDVLVVGGFHTSKIIKLLKEKNYSVTIYSPKITKIDSESGAHYLSEFARKKTPLDKLFAGEKLFINDPALNIPHPATSNEMRVINAAKTAFRNNITGVLNGTKTATSRAKRLGQKTVRVFFATGRGIRQVLATHDDDAFGSVVIAPVRELRFMLPVMLASVTGSDFLKFVSVLVSIVWFLHKHPNRSTFQGVVFVAGVLFFMIPFLGEAPLSYARIVDHLIRHGGLNAVVLALRASPFLMTRGLGIALPLFNEREEIRNQVESKVREALQRAILIFKYEQEFGASTEWGSALNNFREEILNGIDLSRRPVATRYIYKHYDEPKTNHNRINKWFDGYHKAVTRGSRPIINTPGMPGSDIIDWYTHVFERGWMKLSDIYADVAGLIMGEREIILTTEELNQTYKSKYYTVRQAHGLIKERFKNAKPLMPLIRSNEDSGAQAFRLYFHPRTVLQGIPTWDSYLLFLILHEEIHGASHGFGSPHLNEGMTQVVTMEILGRVMDLSGAPWEIWHAFIRLASENEDPRMRPFYLLEMSAIGRLIGVVGRDALRRVFRTGDPSRVDRVLGDGGWNRIQELAYEYRNPIRSPYDDIDVAMGKLANQMKREKKSQSLLINPRTDEPLTDALMESFYVSMGVSVILSLSAFFVLMNQISVAELYVYTGIPTVIWLALHFVRDWAVKETVRRDWGKMIFGAAAIHTVGFLGIFTSLEIFKDSSYVGYVSLSTFLYLMIHIASHLLLLEKTVQEDRPPPVLTRKMSEAYDEAIRFGLFLAAFLSLSGIALAGNGGGAVNEAGIEGILIAVLFFGALIALVRSEAKKKREIEKIGDRLSEHMVRNLYFVHPQYINNLVQKLSNGGSLPTNVSKLFSRITKNKSIGRELTLKIFKRVQRNINNELFQPVVVKLNGDVIDRDVQFDSPFAGPVNLFSKNHRFELLVEDDQIHMRVINYIEGKPEKNPARKSFPFNQVVSLGEYVPGLSFFILKGKNGQFHIVVHVKNIRGGVFVRLYEPPPADNPTKIPGSFREKPLEIHSENEASSLIFEKQIRRLGLDKVRVIMEHPFRSDQTLLNPSHAVESAEYHNVIKASQGGVEYLVSHQAWARAWAKGANASFISGRGEVSGKVFEVTGAFITNHQILLRGPIHLNFSGISYVVRLNDDGRHVIIYRSRDPDAEVETEIAGMIDVDSPILAPGETAKIFGLPVVRLIRPGVIEILPTATEEVDISVDFPVSSYPVLARALLNEKKKREANLSWFPKNWLYSKVYGVPVESLIVSSIIMALVMQDIEFGAYFWNFSAGVLIAQFIWGSVMSAAWVASHKLIDTLVKPEDRPERDFPKMIAGAVSIHTVALTVALFATLFFYDPETPAGILIGFHFAAYYLLHTIGHYAWNHSVDDPALLQYVRSPVSSYAKSLIELSGEEGNLLDVLDGALPSNAKQNRHIETIVDHDRGLVGFLEVSEEDLIEALRDEFEKGLAEGRIDPNTMAARLQRLAEWGLDVTDLKTVLTVAELKNQTPAVVLKNREEAWLAVETVREASPDQEVEWIVPNRDHAYYRTVAESIANRRITLKNQSEGVYSRDGILRLQELKKTSELTQIRLILRSGTPVDTKGIPQSELELVTISFLSRLLNAVSMTAMDLSRIDRLRTVLIQA